MTCLFIAEGRRVRSLAAAFSLQMKTAGTRPAAKTMELA